MELSRISFLAISDWLYFISLNFFVPFHTISVISTNSLCSLQTVGRNILSVDYTFFSILGPMFLILACLRESWPSNFEYYAPCSNLHVFVSLLRGLIRSLFMQMLNRQVVKSESAIIKVLHAELHLSMLQ